MNHYNPNQVRIGAAPIPAPIIIKPYSTSELAMLYGVCPRTFTKWLYRFRFQIGRRVGRYYSSLQVQIIFTKLGTPYMLWEES